MKIYRLFVEKKKGFDIEAKELLRQFDELTGDTLNAAKNSDSAPEGDDGKDGRKKRFWK